MWKKAALLALVSAALVIGSAGAAQANQTTPSTHGSVSLSVPLIHWYD